MSKQSKNKIFANFRDPRMMCGDCGAREAKKTVRFGNDVLRVCSKCKRKMLAVPKQRKEK